jgi:hypothetical protein
MSNWIPDWQIIIDGVDRSDLTLVGMTITSGRTNIYTQAQAGYCNLQLINPLNSNFDINVNSSVTIKVKNSVASYIAIFGGQVSDVATVVNTSGSSAIVTRVDLIAIGNISKLYKAIWQDALAQDFDGNQIDAILTTLLINTWNEVPAADTWNTYDSTEQWLDAQNIGLGEIDTPGQYEMEQRTASEIDFYSLITQIANSALGYIYEDGNGNIGYADSTHRTTYLAANGYTELDAGAAFGVGIRQNISNQNLVNKYILNYGNNNQVTAEDTDSINLYGQYAANFNSNIHDATDAQAVADRQIQLRAYPRPFFDSITFPLQNPELDDVDRDALINVFMGLPVKIINLPPVISDGEFSGYVEGWTFRATTNGLSLTLSVSPTEFSAVAQAWNQVNATETWNSILNTLQWEDAIGVIS